MSQAIHGSVGRGGDNHPHDVTSVQLLLNNARYGDEAELRVDGICGPRTVAAIAAYQRYRMHMTHADGLVQPGGRTIRDLLEISSVKNRSLIREVHQIQKVRSPRSYPTANVDDLSPHPPKLHAALKTPEAHAASSGQTGHKYTDSPLEVPRAGTKVDPLILPGLLQKAWPELNATGARLITAQYMGETTGGKSCWNYNLGNVKCTKDKRKSHLHQYLVGTWEYWSADVAANAVKSNANARYATAAEIAKKVGKESGGKKVVFFKPPDIECCFLAYKSLNDGVVEWTDRYKRMAARNPGLLEQLNKGDYSAFARALHKAGYFSQDEAKYAASMKNQLQYLDGALNK